MRWFWTQFLIFQLLWLTAVIGGNQWLLLCALLLMVHFILSPSRRLDWYVLPIAAIGIALDTLMTLTGVFAFSSFPYWLGALWLGFVLTLGHSLNWLRNIPRVYLFPIGAIAGSISYLAGWRLDAVELPLGLTASVIILTVAWSLLLPTLVYLDSRIRRSA